mgnify:FL=1
MWYSVCCAVKCDKDCQLIPPVYNVSFSHSYLYLTRLCSVNYILSRNKSSGYGPELKSLGRQACDPTTTVQVKLGLKGWGTSVTCLCFEPWCSEYQPCWCWLDSLLSSLYSIWVLHWSVELLCLHSFCSLWALHIEWLALCVIWLSWMSEHPRFTVIADHLNITGKVILSNCFVVWKCEQLITLSWI